MSNTTSFSAGPLAAALSACLRETAGSRCLGDVLEAVQIVQEHAATLLEVACHLQVDLDVDLDSVVLGGWAGEVDAHVPDVVPASWLGTGDEAEGGRA